MIKIQVENLVMEEPEIVDGFPKTTKQDKENHVLTFTSSSTVTNFLKLIGDNRELIEGITVACIGPITAETAEKNGLKVDICAEKYTIDGLVESIQKYYSK